MGWDIAPAQLQTYINPLFDFPFYFFVSQFPNPRWVSFAMGAMHGVTVYILILLVREFFSSSPPMQRTLYSASALAIGLTGASGLPVLGTTLVAWEPAGLILASLYLMLKAENTAHGRAHPLLILGAAGLLAGLAVGGKLTSAPYAAGLAAALLIYRGISVERLKATLIFCSAAFFGMLITEGFWAVLLHKSYQNPLFPYYNDIFRSAWCEPLRFADERFKPRNLGQTLFYPFYWIRTNYGLVTELRFRDIRFAVLYSLALLALVLPILSRSARGEKHFPTLGAPSRLLLLSFLVAYALWQTMFSIYRYLLPLELLSGVVMVILLRRLVTSQRIQIAVLLTMIALLTGSTIYPNWGRTAFGERYFPVPPPALPHNALLVMAGNDPMSFIVPMLDPSVRAVSIENNLLHPTQNNLLVARIHTIIREHPGPMFSISAESRQARIDQVYAAYGLTRNLGQCTAYASKMGERLHICPLSRLAVAHPPSGRE
jgi:hypothetical protein